MKTILPIASLLLLGLAAQAQKAADFHQFQHIVFRAVPGPAQLSLYSRLADTLAPKPSRHVSRQRDVYVVGQYSPRWAVVEYNGYYYFLLQRELLGLRLGQDVRQASASMHAPLPLNEQHLLDFTRVIEVPGASKDELYTRGKIWFANTFQSTLNATQADDKQAGILIGRAWHTSYISSSGGARYYAQVWYTVKLAFKDGRYRYNLTDFGFSNYGGLYTGSSPYQAEGLVFDTRNNGQPTNQALLLARVLNQDAYFLSTELELGMRKPVAGADF